ncbi:uncharacterized protein ISCGN_004786 [Ixodes scapularis]
MHCGSGGVVKLAEEPNRIRECQLLNKTLTSLLIECQRKSDDHHIFVLELHDVSNNLLVKRVTSPTPRFHISELHPTNYYTILVYTTNGVESSRTLNISITSTKAAMSKTLNNGNPEPQSNLATIVGLFMSGVVVFGVIVSIACFCKKHHRHKDNDETEGGPNISEKTEMFSIPLNAQTKVECKMDDIDTVEVVTHYQRDLSEKLPLQCYGSVL